MQRTYLEEDLQLIQKYFPGARTVALRTPFDLVGRETRQALPAASFGSKPAERWYGDLQWSR